jgi:hypothetical protein
MRDKIPKYDEILNIPIRLNGPKKFGDTLLNRHHFFPKGPKFSNNTNELERFYQSIKLLYHTIYQQLLKTMTWERNNN